MHYPPERGASPSRIAKMAGGLCDRSIGVDVITALPNYPTGRIFPDYRRKLSCLETIDGIRVRRYWLYPSNSTNAFKRILNAFSFSFTVFFSIPHLFRSRPNTVIVNTPPLPLALSGIILAKMIRARVITNVSDIWPLSALELGAIRKGAFYSLLEWMEGRVYRYSDAIMTQSSETRQHVLQRQPHKKTFLYRNLDHPSDFIGQHPSISGQALKIVYAGLLGVAQGVYGICKNIDFEKLGVEFHVYGDGNEKTKIAAYVSKNPDCNIILHESIPKRELSKILTSFHATIIPLKNSIKGAFPSKIFMAMSASLPVLFSGSGESAQFVEENGIGWVSGPSDYQALAKNIARLAELPDDEYLLLRNRILHLAKSEFDFNDQLGRLTNFINQVTDLK